MPAAHPPIPGTLVRSEGAAASGIADADNVYDSIGDTYGFYLDNHGRDSIDNAGMLVQATVRMAEDNAYWDGSNLHFGTGFASDDVVAHEFTHGITDYESGLIYSNQSGAINESLADMWGEWVDLGNGRGNDSPEVRWLFGEDTSEGIFRSLSNPPAYSCPDRMGSPYWHSDYSDYGGVHTNSGVGDKLCYLLTDGALFNGRTVAGMGIPSVSRLMYECQAHLLGPASDYNDFYFALGQAAINLGYSVSDREKY